jgi:hypothetical protein
MGRNLLYPGRVGGILPRSFGRNKHSERAAILKL